MILSVLSNGRRRRGSARDGDLCELLIPITLWLSASVVRPSLLGEKIRSIIFYHFHTIDDDGSFPLSRVVVVVVVAFSLALKEPAPLLLRLVCSSPPIIVYWVQHMLLLLRLV